MNLMEAFKALDQLNEDVFSVDAEGIKKLNDFMQNDDSVDELSVFDIDSTEDDVIRDDEECNEGDMILDCCVCHSKVFKPASEIVVDEESQIANAGEECPYCFSVEGYKIVGEVKASGEEEASVDEQASVDEEVSESDEDSIQGESDTDAAEEVSDEPIPDLDSEEEAEVEESVKDRIIKCRMKDRRIGESVDLLTKDNTIASLLRDNMDKLSSITDVNELRDAIMDLVNESDIANKPAALKLKRDLYSKKSVGALLSTIGTYMTGEKVIKVGRNSTKSRKESFKHRRNIKESFKHRRITENVDTIKITSDDITISMDSDNDEDKSIEGTNDNFIVEPVSDEAKEQIDFNSIDRESAEDAIEESLKESFGNVKFFRCSNIVPRNNRFIVEGVIGFNSGRKRNTNFVFKPRKITESKVIFKGYSKELKESVKSMSLVCRNRGKKCIAESLKVSK